MYSGTRKYLSLKEQGRDVLQRTRVVYQEEMFDIMFEAHVIGNQLNVSASVQRSVYSVLQAHRVRLNVIVTETAAPR